MSSYTIETVKGDHTGTLADVIRWQTEAQAAYATISDGIATVDVDDLDFDGEDDAWLASEIERRLAAAARVSA